MNENKLPLTRPELTRRYLAYVDRVATDIDTKVHFEPEEICDMIYTLIEDAYDAELGWYPVLYCGRENLNGRYYSCDEVDPHVAKLVERCKFAGGIYGQLGYPETTDISLSKATHIITDVKFVRGTLYAKIGMVNNENGIRLWEMIEHDEVVFRPRMVGTMDGKFPRIQQIITFDAIPKEEDSFKLITTK